MSIVPFLRDQGFDPEIVDNMSVAFERICDLMGPAPRSVPSVRRAADES
jgi:hypothetical protein